MKFSVRSSLAAALFILGATLLLKQLVHAGMLDGTVATRTVMLTNGVIVALCGNLIPKTLKAPRRSIEAERRVQAALRHAGWAMTLAGIAYAGLWLAAPEDLAQPLSLGVLGIVTLYVFALAARCKLRGDTARA